MKEITIVVPESLNENNFNETTDELCKNGIAKGCYQDYTTLMEVLIIFSQISSKLKEKK